MSGARRGVLSLALVAGTLLGCSSDDEATPDTTGSPDTTLSELAARGTATLTLDDLDLRFDIDTCYRGDGIEPSPDLRLHVEGTSVDDDGVARTLQVVQTESPNGELIDVIRVRPDDGPPGAALEAQRVFTPATGDVHDLWGEGTTPLLDIRQDGDDVVIEARGATFGEFPGGAEDATVRGDGDLDVRCVGEGGDL